MGSIKRFILLFMTVIVLGIPTPVMAAEAITASLPVSCLAEGSSEKFTYILTPEEPIEGQEILIGEQILSNGETGSFQLEFSAPGTYKYSARQNAGTRTDTAYSSIVYTVQAYVTESDDGMICEFVAYEEGSEDKSGSLLFVNTVSPPVTATPTKSEKETITPRATISPRVRNNTETVQRQNQTSAPGQTEKVRTGDESRPLLYVGLAIIALVFILGIMNSRRDKKCRKDS